MGNLKRKESDFFVTTTKEGHRDIKFGSGRFDTFKEVKDYLSALGLLSDRIICHVEVYEYFDENGMFVKSERITQRVEEKDYA